MKKLWFLFITLSLLSLNGCWDLREINDLGFVTAVGVDKADPPNKYAVTVQIANAGSGAAHSDQGQSQSGVWTGTEEGQSLFDAVRSLIKISSRRVMWAHNNVVIIGEPLAKDGILPVVDFFTHNPELRMKTPVVVAKGDAKQYILAKAGMETPSGLSFIYFNDYSALLGESIRSNMLTVSSALATKYVEPLIAAVSLKQPEADSGSDAKSGKGKDGGKSEGKDQGQEKGKNEGKDAQTVDISGAAVFRRAKLIGWLSPEETRGAAWIMNETENVIVTVVDPSHNNQSVAVETNGVSSHIIVKVVGGIPHITLNISGGGSIVEEDGSSHESIDNVKKQVEKLVNRKIVADIKTSLTKIQKEYKVDVFDLAAYIRAQNKREWEKGLKNKWHEVFPKVLFNVRVNIHINSNSLKQEPEKVY